MDYRQSATARPQVKRHPMHPSLSRYLNKTIYVSIPALLEDGVCRPFRLVGAEMNGLWLQSHELTRRLAPDGQLASIEPVVFVPFAQIAGVLVATSTAEPEPKK